MGKLFILLAGIAAATVATTPVPGPSLVGQGPAGATRLVQTTDAGDLRTSNAPMSPQTPVLFPDGGPISVAASTSQCALIGAGRRFELTCKVGDCDCRRVAQNTDGGWAAVASPSDGGASWVVFAGRR